MSFLLVFILVLWQTDKGVYLNDKNPDYVLHYNKYLEVIVNLLRRMMLYIIPCFAVITTITAIGGDYKNGFFEIERSRGVKSLMYFGGRFSAIVTVNVITVIILSLLSVNLYFFTRGGTDNFAAFAINDIYNGIDWELKDYLIDSTMRCIRLVFTCQLPNILLHIGITYMISALLKSSLAGGIGGSSFVVAMFLVGIRYQWKFTSIFYNYFYPTKVGSYMFFTHYDTKFNSPKYIDYRGINGYMPVSLEDTVTWICILLAVVLFSLAVAFVCTHRRRI